MIGAERMKKIKELLKPFYEFKKHNKESFRSDVKDLFIKSYKQSRNNYIEVMVKQQAIEKSLIFLLTKNYFYDTIYL